MIYPTTTVETTYVYISVDKDKRGEGPLHMFSLFYL